MKITRREALKSAVAGLALAGQGCASRPATPFEHGASGVPTLKPGPGIPATDPQGAYLQRTNCSIPLNEDEDDDEEFYRILVLAFSSDSNKLAAVRADGTVRVWDVSTEE